MTRSRVRSAIDEHPPRRRACPLGWLLLLLAAALLAPAAAADRATAEVLFQAGKKLLASSDYAGACAKFLASNEQDPSPGTLLNLGLCSDKQGKTASAWAYYKQAGAMARQRGEKNRAEVADDFVAKVEPRLSRLTIQISATAEGLEVRRDAETVSPAVFGVPVAIDPGEHQIAATAPGHKRWSTTVTLGAEAESQTVTVPALEPEAAAAPTAAPIEVAPAPIGSGAAPPDTAAPEPEPPPPGPSEGGGLSGGAIAGIVVASVGGVGLVLGTIFGGLAASTQNDADPLCPEKACSPEGFDKIDSARNSAGASTVAFIAGGVLATAGVLIAILTAGGDDTEQAALDLQPMCGPYGCALSVGGRF